MRRTGRLALLLLAVPAARVPGQEPKRETVAVSNSAFLTLRVGKAGRSVQLPGEVRVVLDGDAVGAFLQTQADATMRAQPLGLTLSFAPPKPLLGAACDAAKQRLQVMMRESVVTTLPVERKERRMPLLLMLRQRDQMPLFAVPVTGGDALLLSLRSADYELLGSPTEGCWIAWRTATAPSAGSWHPRLCSGAALPGAELARAECGTSQAVTTGRRIHERQQWGHFLYLGAASVAGPERSVPTCLRTLRE